MSGRLRAPAALFLAGSLLVSCGGPQRAARGELLAPERPPEQLLDAAFLACKDLGLDPAAAGDQQVACMSTGADGVPCACGPETIVLAELEGEGLILSVTSRSDEARELLASFAAAIRRRLEEHDRPPLPPTLRTSAPCALKDGEVRGHGAARPGPRCRAGSRAARLLQ